MNLSQLKVLISVDVFCFSLKMALSIPSGEYICSRQQNYCQTRQTIELDIYNIGITSVLIHSVAIILLCLPTGEFYQSPKKEAPLKGDRAEVKKPKDNLRPEGEFSPKKTSEVTPLAERRKPIKHSDNLKPEGDFYRGPKAGAPLKGDRAEVKKPKDNLQLAEGDFSRRTVTNGTIVNGQRRTLIKHEDNLHMEGKNGVASSLRNLYEK